MKIPDAKVLSFINTKMAAAPCDVCGQRSWTYDATIYELREYNGGGMVIGGNTAILPMITLSCSNCGNTKLFNAIAAGLIDRNGKVVA